MCRNARVARREGHAGAGEPATDVVIEDRGGQRVQVGCYEDFGQ